MAFFNECPLCGANLDPGEECECIKESIKKQQLKYETEMQISVLQEMDCSQMMLQFY